MTPDVEWEVGGEDEDILRLLTGLQTAVVRHPAAAQGLYGALVAEGRRFASTPEGARWASRLRGSEVVRRARLVVEASTLWMLEAEPGTPLPSTYVDAVFMAAGREDLEILLDELARARKPP